MLENDFHRKSDDIWGVTLKASIALGFIIVVVALCVQEAKQNERLPQESIISAPE